jgi:putative nucleotidyltransferase with HDIG domain
MPQRCGKRQSATALPTLDRADDSGPGHDTQDITAHVRTPNDWGLTAKVRLSPVRGSFNSVCETVFGRFLKDPRQILLVAYAGALAIAAIGLVCGLVAAGFGMSSPYAVSALGIIAIVAEVQSVRLTPTYELSVASVPFIFAAVLFGPLAALIVGSAGLVPDLLRRDTEQPYLRWTVWTASRALIAGSVGLVTFAAVGTRPTSMGLLLLAVVVASATDVAGDLLLSPIAPAIRGKTTWRDLVRTLVPLQLSSVPLHVPFIAILAYAYVHVSPWSVAFFVIPAFAAQRLFLLYRQQRETSAELTSANQRLEKANLSFATALVATLDARDRYTAGHSAAVAIYAKDIATRMGLDSEAQHLAHLAGLVHDLGKIGLPPGLLEKPGALTLDERRQMEEHSVIGERILRKVDDYAEIADIVRHHHERVDGNGYPDNLMGEEIPLLARVIAVADAYNAMTSDRPYRDAMPSRVARLRLAQAVETQFDTTVVAAFEAILAGASEEYRQGIHADFALEAASASRSEFRVAAVA